MQQYEFKNFHHVPAAIVYCLDPRFRMQHERFIAEELGFDQYDQYVFPGGPKALADVATRDAFIGAIGKASIGLHGVKEIVLIAHRDCGAYGGSRFFDDKGGAPAEKAAQIEDLKIAKGVLTKLFPEITVTMFYADIAGDKVEIYPVENRK